LVAQNFISRRTVDESAAALQVAEAKLALARATAARLKILAPFDGLAGIRLVNVGDYLKDGADIVNIEDIEAIYVDYRLPERFQSKVRRGQLATVELDALPGRKFKAVLQAIDPLIDANGRSVGVRACIDNRRLQLRPGMFARVNTVFGQRDDARVILEAAIVPQAGKQFVIKLQPGPDAQGFVTQRVEVKVGQRMPGKVEIVDGLGLGDTVVIAGQQRVQRDGTSVRVLEMAATPATPAASAAPAAATTAQPAKALAPLTGPDPCRAGMADTASPTRKSQSPA
jgi:membrane fusion protein (multidrug efflux system)